MVTFVGNLYFEQVGQKVYKTGKNRQRGMTTSPMRGLAPAKRT